MSFEATDIEIDPIHNIKGKRTVTASTFPS